MLKGLIVSEQDNVKASGSGEPLPLVSVPMVGVYVTLYGNRVIQSGIG